MAAEKFIIGKVDAAKHSGKRAEVRRIQEANNQMKEHVMNPNQQYILRRSMRRIVRSGK